MKGQSRKDNIRHTQNDDKQAIDKRQATLGTHRTTTNKEKNTTQKTNKMNNTDCTMFS